jgi:carbamoylphosphate synthase large subunit
MSLADKVYFLPLATEYVINMSLAITLYVVNMLLADKVYFLPLTTEYVINMSLAIT